MNPIAVAGIILGVALARFTAICISAGISSFFTEEVWLASFYYPAGAVDVIALITLGYWAAVGSGLASVAWNVWQFDLSAFEIAINLVAAVARGMVALWIFNVLVPRPRDKAWVVPTLKSVLLFSVVYAIVSACVGYVLLDCTNLGESLTEGELVSLFAGTILGSYGGFLVLSLAFSAYLSSRLRDD